MAFRLANIGLTYSNVDQQAERLGLPPLNHESFKNELFVHLLNLQRNKPQSILICQEKHQDGAFHYHCMVRWINGGRRVDHTFFDFNGIHPSIEQLVGRGIYRWENYCKKDDPSPFEWVEVFDVETDDAYESGEE